MCYDLSQIAERAYRAAIRDNAPADVIEHYRKEYEKYRSDVEDYYHVSGFNHPKLLIVNKDGLQLNTWGLIPHWVKDEATAKEIWNKTINARGETIFEKPSFRDAAKNRCIIPVDGFFEHHHKGGNTFPFYVKKKDDEPLLLGGIESEWVNKETGEIISSMSIVTTKGNNLLSNIHNNPKMKEARMPVIIKSDNIDQWLNGNKDDVQELITPYPDSSLMAHAVRRIRGKNAIGNYVEALEEYDYPELNEPPELF